jgi:branched-chain amino acid aminotransferase
MSPAALYSVFVALRVMPDRLCWFQAGWGEADRYGIPSSMSADGFDSKPGKALKSAAEREAILKGSLGFGRLFTEHMVTIRYSGGAWQRGELVPYGPITLDPAASVLHYGQSIFEGFKAYRQPGGGISTFRPEANGKRFAASARRLAMPELPVELFVGASDVLLKQEQAWVPSGAGESMYLRPLMIATEAALGVKPAKEYTFLLFGSPSGDYFPQGVKPISLWLCTDYVRAAPGGTGEAKCAGNYAASLVAQQKAIDEGCVQVIWLDAVERKWVEEMGGMNLFFVYKDGAGHKLVTPKLTGTLLAGVTRDSLLKLAGDLGYATEERMVSVEQWEQGLKDGSLIEVFACGTAAVITPVGEVKSDTGTWSINNGEFGPHARKLRESLLAIQYGTSPDTHGWMHRVL